MCFKTFARQRAQLSGHIHGRHRPASRNSMPKRHHTKVTQRTHTADSLARDGQCSRGAESSCSSGRLELDVFRLAEAAIVSAALWAESVAYLPLMAGRRRHSLRRRARTRKIKRKVSQLVSVNSPEPGLADKVGREGRSELHNAVAEQQNQRLQFASRPQVSLGGRSRPTRPKPRQLRRWLAFLSRDQFRSFARRSAHISRRRKTFRRRRSPRPGVRVAAGVSRLVGQRRSHTHTHTHCRTRRRGRR